MLASILGVLWLVLFYCYNYRTLSVSKNSLQHEFQTSKELGTETFDGVHGLHLHSNKIQTSVINGSWNLVQYTHNINNRFKENSPAPVSQIVHNDSHIHATEVAKDDIRQHQNSVSHDSNAAINLIPGWLRSDPLVQQLLSRQNISRSSRKHESLDEAWTAAKPVQKPLKPVKEPLLASGHRPTGSFEFDVQHSVDRYKRIVLSVVDSGFVNFAVNFQRLSIDNTELQNFLFVCIDQQAVTMLQQHGIACSYFHISTAIQVSEKMLFY